jgi:hypothetical protein
MRTHYLGLLYIPVRAYLSYDPKVVLEHIPLETTKMAPATVQGSCLLVNSFWAI